MSPSDLLPSAGSQVGRYQFLREIAKGPFGALHELRAADDGGSLNGLGRVIPIPSDLPAEVSQAVSECAWDSLELQHNYVLSVADVVFEKDWFTLIHDFSEGSVVRSLQRRCAERGTAFPVDVAARVVVDLLDGLDKTRLACDKAGIRWLPGAVNASSLYLCGDGRTRSLDGQLNAVLMRLPETRMLLQGTAFPPPEVVDQTREPNERADVFGAAVVLWELLTGQELKLERTQWDGSQPRPAAPDLGRSVPKDAKTIPLRIRQLVSTALSLDPTNRLATIAEFRNAIVNGVEVAGYAEVIDFTDALLTRESTLFRLDLAPPPKLSATNAAVRPADRKPDWLTELAKKAQAGDAKRASSATVAEPKRVLNPPPKPSTVSTQMGPAGEPFASQLKVVEQVTTQISEEQSTESRPSQTSTPRLTGYEPSQARATADLLASRPKMQTLMGIRPEDALPKAAPIHESREVPAQRPLAKHTFVGVGPAPTIERQEPVSKNNGIPQPEDVSPPPREGSQTPGQIALSTTQHGPFTPSVSVPEHTLRLEPLVAQTLAVLTEAEGAAARPPTAAPAPLVELVPTRPEVQRGANITTSKAPERRVFQLGLPALILGGIAITAIAVGATLLAQRSLSKNAARPTATPQAVVSSQTFAPQPSSPPLSTHATEPTPTAATTTTTEPAPAPASVEKEAKPEKETTPTAPAVAPMVTPATANKPAAKPATVPAKRTARKQPRKYVPSGL